MILQATRKSLDVHAMRVFDLGTQDLANLREWLDNDLSVGEAGVIVTTNKEAKRVRPGDWVVKLHGYFDVVGHDTFAKEFELKLGSENDIVTDVKTCARCAEDHAALTFKPLENSLQFTHYAPCPTNGKPILLYHCNGIPQPLLNKIVVEPHEAEKNIGSLIIPQTAQERPHRGFVRAVGPGCVKFDGTTTPPFVEVGMEILYARYAGTDVEVNGKVWKIMSETDVLAYVT